MQQIKIQQFEGPLDLLLQLIEQNELDITEISLATVTDQYINLLRATDQIDLDELSDFLVVAAKLLLIKSRTLLPQLAVGLDDEGRQLERQLKIYRAFLEAAKAVQGLLARRRFAFSRDSVVTITPVFYPPRRLTREDLASVLRTVIENVQPYLAPPPEAISRSINIQQKIEQIRNQILEGSLINFSTLLKQSKSKMDIIVTFLALLELVKQRTVAVVQPDRFADIEIKHAGEPQA